MPSPIALLKHADRIAWHSFAALLFIASGVAINTIMCGLEDFGRRLDSTRTYLNGPFGTLVITRMPCGVHCFLANHTPIDLAAARAAGACFTPSPRATAIEGEAVPDSLFSVNPDLWIVAATASGWPMCCFEGFRVAQFSTTGPMTYTQADVSLLALDDPSGFNTRWAIPTHPRWLPLAVNFTTGVGVSILISNFAQSRRRSRRLRRGLCPTCAYNRASLAPAAPCPECGAAPSP